MTVAGGQWAKFGVHDHLCGIYSCAERTKDGGKKWQRLSKGLPQKDAYFTVLRDGARADTNDPAGIYVGTTTGQVYFSRDDGDSWGPLADHLPPVHSIEAGVVGGPN